MAQEMYAFTLACYNAGVEHIDLHKKMMARPPWDTGALCALRLPAPTFVPKRGLFCAETRAQPTFAHLLP